MQKYFLLSFLCHFLSGPISNGTDNAGSVLDMEDLTAINQKLNVLNTSSKSYDSQIKRLETAMTSSKSSRFCSMKFMFVSVLVSFGVNSICLCLFVGFCAYSLI